MDIEKAIDILRAYRVGGYGTLMDIRVMFEAIDTVLAELDRQNEEIKNYQNTIEVIEDLGRKKIGEIVEKALKGEE